MKKDIPNLPQAVALITGGISVVLGLVLMGAWHLRLTARLQVLPDSPLIYYNTALVFLLSGLALLALAKQWQRQQGEEVLRESEARLKLALEAGRLGIWEWNVLTGEVIWSAQCEALFGLTPDSFRGTYEAFARLVHPDDLESVTRSLQEAMQQSGEWELDYRVVHPDDSIRWIGSTGKFFYNEAGQAVRMLGVAKDITQRKQTEQMLWESQSQLNLAMEAAHLGTWDLNFLTGKGSWARQLDIFFGSSPEDISLALETWLNALHPEDWDVVNQVLKSSMEEEGTQYQVEYRVIRPDGGLSWIESRGQVDRDKTGKPIHLTGVSLDISDRKRAEDALRQLNETLEIRVAERTAQLAQANTQLQHELLERQRAEQALQENQSLLSGIIEGTTDLIAALDLDFRYTAFNSAYKAEFMKIFGREIEIGTSMIEALAHLPEEQANAVDIWGRAIAGEEFTVIQEFGDSARQRNYYEITYSSIRDENRQRIGASQIAKDVSDRIRAELELTRSRDLKEAIFHESADAIFLVDPETLLTLDCNRRAIELFESSRKDELIGISGHILQRQQFTPEELAAIVQEINTRGFWSLEVEYVTKKGNLFWGNLAAKQINVVGKMMNLVRVSDITERKQAEKVLELQAVITRNMAEGIYLVRVADSAIVYANPKFERMFGYEPGELNGKHASVVNYEDERISAEEVALTLMQEILQHGEDTYEVHNLKKNGTPFWCRATTSIFDHPEYGTVLVGVQQDITERKQAEEQIKASLREKEVLLKEIHHRVKNNLQIVDSLLQMQARRTKEQQAAEILRDSQNRIASIALVHEKLYRSEDLANIDLAQYIPDLTTHLFDTYNVSSDTINLNIKVEEIFLEVDTAIPCGLIINELVSNSLKYAFTANREGEIQIEFYANSDSPISYRDAPQTERLSCETLCSPPHTLTLIVRDNGIGISEEFDIENTQSLGLTLVQGLVEQLEGTINLDRSQGTEFRITFPGGRT